MVSTQPVKYLNMFHVIGFIRQIQILLEMGAWRWELEEARDFDQDGSSGILGSVCVCVSNTAFRVIIFTTGCSSGGLMAYCLFVHYWLSSSILLRRRKPTALGALVKSFQ